MVTPTKLLLSIVLGVLFLQSCKIIDPPEKIPTYIYIKDITVNTNLAAEGTNSDNIVDAWVYINDNLIGTFELPAKIPVIAEGNYNLKIYGGIKNSGFVAQRKIYPFYNYFETNLAYKKNKTDTIFPVLTYKSNANIWIEDFEDPGIKFNTTANSDTTIKITLNPLNVFEGNGAGIINFNASDNFFECRTNEPLFNSFPKFGKPIYIELNYKTNNVLAIGLLHGDNSITNLIKSEYLNLTSTNGKWKKIYIDFTELVSTKTSATKHQIYFEVRKQIGVTNPIVIMDNIKVIY